MAAKFGPLSVEILRKDQVFDCKPTGVKEWRCELTEGQYIFRLINSSSWLLGRIRIKLQGDEKRTGSFILPPGGKTHLLETLTSGGELFYCVPEKGKRAKAKGVKAGGKYNGVIEISFCLEDPEKKYHKLQKEWESREKEHQAELDAMWKKALVWVKSKIEEKIESRDQGEESVEEEEGDMDAGHDYDGPITWECYREDKAEDKGEAPSAPERAAVVFAGKSKVQYDLCRFTPDPSVEWHGTIVLMLVKDVKPR